MAAPHPLFAHLLAQTRQNVQLLVAHGQMPQTDGDEILSKLSAVAAKYPEDASVASLTQQTERLTVSPAPPGVKVRAIWDWNSEDPNDLSFQAGDVIEVTAETNADWWTGRNRSGNRGLFPSNYVEKLPAPNASPIVAPEPRKSAVVVRSSGPGLVEQRYASPALPHPPPRGPPQPYPMPQYYPPPGPPPGPISYAYGPPPPQQILPAPQPAPDPVPQQAPAKKSKFGGLGQMMAQSAAGGLGFGAGAAIGGDIVNAIF